MPSHVTVIADDLTGACEIAGRGLAFGLKSVVSLDQYRPDPDIDLDVIDSDSRLDPPTLAEEKVEGIAAKIPLQVDSLLFKKTDSVLRGSVHAEIAAMMRATKKRSALLVPANPHLGRGIAEGIYTIKGRPLNETEFADDPHHPATDANVLHLLQGERLPVRSAKPSPLLSAARGELVVGDAMTDADLREWAAAVTDDILPAGSAAFFHALLERWFPRTGEPIGTPFGEGPFPKDGLTLFVSGTLAPAQRALLDQLAAAGGPIVSLDTAHLDPQTLAEAAEQVAQHFRTSGKAVIRVQKGSGAVLGQTSGNILKALSELTATLLSRHPIVHLAIEGGATAAAICKRMGYLRLSVVREWSPGTVMVKPLQNDTAPAVTVKPGSYPWPPSIHDTLFQNPSQPTST